MASIETFINHVPDKASEWRAIILFGQNSASYKFALAKALIELAKQDKTRITLDELAPYFAKPLIEHIKDHPKQGTAEKSLFLEACRDFSEGKLTEQKLYEITAAKGFNNVLDAFHTVNRKAVPNRFFEKDFSSSSKGIVLTDNLYEVMGKDFSENFLFETDARWSLVETAWEQHMSRSLLDVHYDIETKQFAVRREGRRIDVTSARDALNGYQKGHCFYCFDAISIDPESKNLCDVDHFFPKMLEPYMPGINIDGVFNLVLACQKCNRGLAGKFAQVPDKKYLERLHRRNEYLIESHHPLRETLIKATGASERERRAFLSKMDEEAVKNLVHRWETPAADMEYF